MHRILLAINCGSHLPDVDRVKSTDWATLASHDNMVACSLQWLSTMAVRTIPSILVTNH